MFPEFFQNSSRIPLSSVPLTGEFAEYTITVIFVLYFISFILLKYFLTFPVRIFSLGGANRSRILQEFRTEFRFQKQQASPKGKETYTIWSGIYSVLGSCKQFLEVVRHSVIGQ